MCLVAVVATALLVGSCGGSGSAAKLSAATAIEVLQGKLTPSTKTPLTIPAPSRLCPPSDANPRAVLLKSAGDVLVPGHPSSALICRYWSEESEGAVTVRGHPAHRLAEARKVVRPEVVTYLAGELDALKPISPRANCDEILGDRSELILFHYHGHAEARVLIERAGCIPVTNGRITRGALGAGHGNGAPHWEDERLL